MDSGAGGASCPSQSEVGLERVDDTGTDGAGGACSSSQPAVGLVGVGVDVDIVWTVVWRPPTP